MEQQPQPPVFRGKRLDNNEWAYGYYEVSTFANGSKLHHIKEMCDHGYCKTHDVKSTIGWSSGLKDKNGKEIFLRDILISPSGTKMTICWNSRFASFALRSTEWAFDHFFAEAINPEQTEIIGTIHD